MKMSSFNSSYIAEVEEEGNDWHSGGKFAISHLFKTLTKFKIIYMRNECDVIAKTKETRVNQFI